MPATNPASSAVNAHGPIQYHGYFALMCSFDDSTWVRMGRQPDTHVHRRFTTICRDYHKRIDENRSAWCRSRGLDENERSYPSYLYNPACYLTFGHSDSVGIVLIDDIDAMMDITADFRSPVEQVQLAYCPTLHSLGLPANQLFSELHELLDPPPNTDPAHDNLPVCHGIQTMAPLLMWTKLKLNGIAMLAEGLLVQQAAYRAFARRITQVVATLANAVDSHAPPSGAPLYNLDDLTRAHLRVVFLDPQGSEEVSILVFSRNYSIGISILTALRSLTFADLFREDPLIKACLSVSPTHRRIAAACQPGRRTTSSPVDDLADNHLLSKTYTTLGIAYGAFDQPDTSGCTGFVIAYPHFDINPGHLGHIEPLLLQPLISSSPPSHPTALHEDFQQLGAASDIHRFLVGRHDYLLELNPSAGTAMIRALPLIAFIRLMSGIYSRTGCVSAGQSTETGLLDISTSIVVPFPRLLDSDGTDQLLPPVGQHHRAFMPLLERMRQAISAAPSGGVPGEHSGHGGGFYELLDSLRVLSLPSSLRRTIRYFYQDFSHCLSDPFLFEGVLDLFDTFLTLCNLLCHILPQAQRQEPEDRSERGLFSAADLYELESLLGALHNALMHRMAFSLPQEETRDMAVDFRGGLNRLVAAADVPLKCGLGILRRLIYDQTRQSTELPSELPTIPVNAPARKTVGAVTRITFNPIPIVSSLTIGQKWGVWLGHIDMDVAHIVNPFEYPMYVHEVSHLILRSMPTWDPWLKRAKTLVLEKTSFPNATSFGQVERSIHVNLEEISVEMLTFLFVFAPDCALFRKYLTLRFNSHPAVSGSTVDVTLARFAEILIRVFFVTDPFDLSSRAIDWDSCLPESLEYRPTFDDSWERFREMSRAMGPLFREYYKCAREGHKRDCFEQYLQSIFTNMFPRYQLSISRVWSYVIRVYQNACSTTPRAVPWSLCLEDRESLVAFIRETIAQGVPFIRSVYREKLEQRSGNVGSAYTFDEFFIVNRVLQSYLKATLDLVPENGSIHVPRDDVERRIDLSVRAGSQEGWSSVLLDQMRPGLFYVDPVQRDENVRRQIAVLKTLSDQSSTLRGRRFYDLLVLTGQAKAEPGSNPD